MKQFDDYEYNVINGGNVSIMNYIGKSSEIVIPSEINGRPVIKIEMASFSGNRNIKKIVIPDSIKTIGQNAFSSCTALKEIVIPDSVKQIGVSAFSDCTSLERAVISNGIATVGAFMFRNCYSLTDVVIPDGITRIDTGAFRHCKKLKSVIIPDSVREICSEAFEYCLSLENVVIPDSVIKIGDNAFSDCPALSNLKLPDNLFCLNYRKNEFVVRKDRLEYVYILPEFQKIRETVLYLHMKFGSDRVGEFNEENVDRYVKFCVSLDLAENDNADFDYAKRRADKNLSQLALNDDIQRIKKAEQLGIRFSEDAVTSAIEKLNKSGNRSVEMMAYLMDYHARYYYNRSKKTDEFSLE